MKKMFIIGKDSYIGTSFEKWVSQWSVKYTTKTIDMRDKNWRENSSKGYDSVLHVTALV